MSNQGVIDLMNENARLRERLECARKALEEIAAIGSKITDPKNVYGIQMGNIAHAAHIETALTDEEGNSK